MIMKRYVAPIAIECSVITTGFVWPLGITITYYIAWIGLQTLKSRRFGKIRQGASNVLKSQKTKISSMNATT